MPSTFDVRSNIFGITTSGSPTPDIPFSTSQTTEAGKLIDKLKNIADNQIQKVAAGVDWLGRVSDQGQNAEGGVKSLIGYQNVKPDALTKDNIFKNWVAPEMPALPTFPTLPSDLKIDMTPFKANIDELVNKLQSMWIAKFIPATTDISNYDTLMKDILNGSNDSTNTALLKAIYDDLTAAVTQSKGEALTETNAQVTALKAALAASVAGLQPLIDAAITTAQDNSSNIIWARARSQAAREGARLEAEAVAEYAARGFSLPGGTLLAQAAVARQATLDAASKIAGEEAARTQLANVDLAKVAIDGWLRKSDFELRSNVESMKSVLEARMRYSAFQLDADRSRAEQAVKNLGLRLDFTRFAGEFALKYRMEAASAMNALVNAYANLNRTEMEYYAAIANAQRANLDALINYYRLSLAQSEMGMKVSLANTENDIKWAEVAGSFIGNSVGHHVQAASAAANLYAQMAGQALSGLNSIASVSVSG